MAEWFRPSTLESDELRLRGSNPHSHFVTRREIKPSTRITNTQKRPIRCGALAGETERQRRIDTYFFFCIDLDTFLCRLVSVFVSLHNLCLSIFLSMFISLYLLIDLYFSLHFLHLPVYLLFFTLLFVVFHSLCHSIYISVGLSVYRSIYLSFYPRSSFVSQDQFI